ncbi:MAG TPA: hypothetical protein VEV43_08815 [Actinomycetota bacterium]|nr:hypothetical protein [Actinomycetota bacterium]
MHGTYISAGVRWSTWGVAFAGALLAHAGWKAAGLTVWLLAVAAQWVLGIRVLINRRKARGR